MTFVPTFFNVTCRFPWWRHQMEVFSICAGNSPVSGEVPAQRPWHGTLMFSLIRAWKNGWVNNREAGDLSRHRAHYDVNVMYILAVPYCRLLVCACVLLYLGHTPVVSYVVDRGDSINSSVVAVSNSGLLECVLTHWGRDKIAAIFQTTFSNAFSWMKMYD